MKRELPLVMAGVVSLVFWLALALHPRRPWDLEPVAEDEPAPPEPNSWPSACIVVPARNEARYLPRTLPTLLRQDYPGDWGIVLVDDRSTDDTADVARQQDPGSKRLEVIAGEPLPDGWAGKVWALAQGARAAKDARYLLFTDADIAHAPRSLRRLVAESEAQGLALNSRMARLRAVSPAEKLLIPPFLLFFNLLYPMRAVNRPGRMAAAAGGCILIRHDVLARTDGLGAIKSAMIDDISLAKAVKHIGMRVRLSLSREDVVSLREYESIERVWRMVRRTAFEQLRYSWVLLAGTCASLALLFVLPPRLVSRALLGRRSKIRWRVASGLVGGAAWAVMAAVFQPTIRYFGLPRRWSLTLPLGGTLYGAMTVDSGVRHALGQGGWD